MPTGEWDKLVKDARGHLTEADATVRAVSEVVEDGVLNGSIDVDDPAIVLLSQLVVAHIEVIDALGLVVTGLDAAYQVVTGKIPIGGNQND